MDLIKRAEIDSALILVEPVATYGILRQRESGKGLRAIKSWTGTTDCDACEAGPGVWAQGWRTVTDYPGNAAVTSKVQVGRNNVSKGPV